MRSTTRHGLSALALTLLLLLALPHSAQAHRVNVFAVVEGGSVVVDCYYSRGEKVHAGKVEVYDAATGEKYLDGVTNDEGGFTFPVPRAARAAGHDLRIVLSAGEGHRAESVVTAKEYGAAEGGTASASMQPEAPEAQPAAAPAAPTAPDAVGAQGGASVGAMDAQTLERIVDRTVQKRLAPVVQMLMAQQEKGPGLTEIVGGLGWIVGLFGLVAWFRAKKRP
ncbi:hypothetical protein [Desulfovibrio sp. X2]|uniref:hypothetical protein n=1 Tax=Desulfovibrio sp. X2 TaxID=941449 RepID=UPI0004071D07|nr:hypothetical protein [Desulfovibrio sp. X2]